MASPQGYDQLFTRAKIEMLDFDVDATTATASTYKDMRDYGGFALLCMTSVLGGTGTTLLEIVAADDDSGTNITVIKTSGAVVADAVGDYVVLECSAEEIAQESADAGATLRYVAARVTNNNAGDENVLTYIRYAAKHPADGLTATTIA